MNEEKDKPLEEEKIQSDDLFERTETSLVVTKDTASTSNLDEEIGRHEFLNKQKNDALDLEKKRFDLSLHKIQRITIFIVFLVLFVTSFFIMYYDDKQTGLVILFSSLATLGVNVFNLPKITQHEKK